jgi:hypothetical protein
MKHDRWIDFVARVNAKLEFFFSFSHKFKVQNSSVEPLQDDSWGGEGSAKSEARNTFSGHRLSS